MAKQDVTRDDMLAEIAEILRPPEPPPDSFTGRDMAKLWGCTNDAAVARLNKDERVECLGMIGKCNYYRLKDD